MVVKYDNSLGSAGGLAFDNYGRVPYCGKLIAYPMMRWHR